MWLGKILWVCSTNSCTCHIVLVKIENKGIRGGPFWAFGGGGGVHTPPSYGPVTLPVTYVTKMVGNKGILERTEDIATILWQNKLHFNHSET